MSGSGGDVARALKIRSAFEAVLQSVHANDAPAFRRSVKRFSKRELMELKDGYGRTILHHAAQHGHTSICETMLGDLGMDANVQDSTGEDTWTTMAELPLSFWPTSGETPLAMACATGHLETASLLISKGADVNLRREPDGTAPLHRAANSNKSVEV